MDLPRVYIETTIPSYLTARPTVNFLQLARQELTRRWWNQARSRFELFVSQEVIREVSLGDSEMAEARLERLSGIPLLDVNRDVESVAERLITSGVLPAKAYPDAIHIGVASIHGMDFILTWNCRHIANPMIQRRLACEVAAMDHVLPVICTPEELTDDESDNDT